MKPSLIQRLGQRFGTALSMLVALCAVLLTLSALQASELGQSARQQPPVPPSDSMAVLRQAIRHLDQIRGLEALHLLALSPAEKRSYEIALGGQRRAIESLIGHSRAAAGDAPDRQHGERVRADLAAYFALEDQMLALSQRALADQASAAGARELLGGASQVLFERLRERLDAWWTHRESRAREGLLAARAQATALAWAIALIGGAALVLAALLRWAYGRDATPVAGVTDAEPSRVQQVRALIAAARGPAAISVGVAAGNDADANADSK